MKKIEIAEIKEKSLEFVKDHKDTIAMFGVAFAGGLICFKLGEFNERAKPDYEKMLYKQFTKECFRSITYDGPFKIHSFDNTTLGKLNGLNTAKSVIDDPEVRDSIAGLAIFIKEN